MKDKNGLAYFQGTIILLLVGVSALLAIWGHFRLEAFSTPPSPPLQPQRIVSLAPSITEILFALGLGEQVMGRTTYCLYPPEVQKVPVVAGFSEVNLEAVLRARPDLAILPIDKTRNRENLEQLGIPVLTINTRSLDGLMQAINRLGQQTGRQAQAQAINERLSSAMHQARKQSAGRKRPKVLFSVMHSYEGLGYITEINAIGRDGFFNNLIEIAGGENAYQGSLSFPRLSREAIIYLNPDVILDVINDNIDLESVRQDWSSLSMVSAIANKRLILLTDQSATIPGPRFDQILRELSAAFHPEDDHVEN